MRIIPVNCITQETKLAKTIHNSNGNVLLRQGTTLTASLLEKIKNAGINTVYIDDGYSDVEIEDVIKPELRYAAVKTIKETFKNIENDLAKKLSPDRELNKRLQAKVMNKYVENLRNVSNAIIEDIMKSHNLLINVIDIKHLGEYTYEHSLNVAVLSLITGMALRMNRHDLLTLFTGAILHDLGKVFIPTSVLEAGEEITIDEYEEYKSHTTQGYGYVKENKGFSATSKIVILQHHEHYDGTGFPNGTSGDAIHKNARIVAICNQYDKMVSDSIGSPAVPASEAIEYIMGNAGTKFDFDIANIFVRRINPYPVGTLVDLSTLQTAVVIDTNIDFPLRPVVQVLELSNGQVHKRDVIDLLKITDVTIKQIRYKDVRDED
ncbi:HD-GYP domain-containing protein [Acidaminobacter sp. JC074]|uniref:HD-GYP domain-containing protein n=1 Tax=Acidaminobacter sp. JC074 TaxID=2530199 RepID=UPI001F0F972C|nr:HD-GYP domain-containing protein [Acidaminobacter sp. JC074]MCH4886640.1 HD-GYP domain-containing protein [Acidaminobacter sp. JC074]